jgi:HAD superfamily hydrolase (TIGR01490 family)
MDTPGGGSPAAAAAFFDLDKTIISGSSTLAFVPSFYRQGLISRAQAIRGAIAQLVFLAAGADHKRMERIKEQVSALCRGWSVERVTEIVTANLAATIAPIVYAEARGLLDDHRAAGRDVFIVSTSGQEVVGPIGAMLGASGIIATRMRLAGAGTPASWSTTRTARARPPVSAISPRSAAMRWPIASRTATRSPTSPCSRRWGTRTPGTLTGGCAR